MPRGCHFDHETCRWVVCAACSSRPAWQLSICPSAAQDLHSDGPSTGRIVEIDGQRHFVPDGVFIGSQVFD
jgi:hypothetical protein